MFKIFFIPLVLLTSSLFSHTPQQSLQELMEGNQRFSSQKSEQIAPDKFSPSSYKVHAPFAVIVTCSDARVAPEVIFDQGMGDLFVVRVAGNVIGAFELESIQYAVQHLGASCLLVMGHQNCGAVEAVVQNQAQDIPFLAQLIEPAVTLARQSQTDQLLCTSIEINAIRMAQFLNQDTLINSLQSNQKLIVVPAYFDFQSGQVLLLQSNLQ